MKQRCNELESSVCGGGYTPKPVIRLKVEKSKGLCRQVTVPAPEDALLLQALSNALWATIQSKAPSPNAFYAAQDQKFSKLNKTEDEDEFGYGPIAAWLDFQRTILGFSSQRNYVVVTDVANYYDSILHSFLRAILSDYAHEREHALDLIIFAIDNMIWRPDYMPNYGIGLPQMDFDAPRLLAHTHLFEIDEIFGNRSDLDYARYMDDMDFGVDSIAAAKTVLRDLDLALQTRNLRLNNGKTRIMSAHEALIHFRAVDNATLDKLDARIKLHSLNSRRVRVLGALAARAVNSGLMKGRFDQGNGEKVLKRLLRICISTRSFVSLAAFRTILVNRPALRQILLRLWSWHPDCTFYLPAVIGFMMSGESVDDHSVLLIATGLVESGGTATFKQSHLNDVLAGFSRQDAFQLYCRLWIISRFGSIHELKAEIDVTNLIWSRHAFLCRTVAGFYGLFVGSPHQPSYLAFVRKWGGPNSIAVLEFHEGLEKDKSGFDASKAFISKPNTTLPNSITHAKSLMLASMLWNNAIAKADRAKILGVHSRMMFDPHYRYIFSNIITAAP